MSERQRGLGRGLSALLGEEVGAAVAGEGGEAPAGVRMAAIETLHPNPDQPRKRFADAELDELAQSIRERGIIQPILVRSRPGGQGEWEIIAGERRWRAAQKARLDQAPIVVREMDDAEVFEVAIIENVQRADLNPFEEAEAFKALSDRHGRSVDQIAGVVGKSRSHVANTLRLLQLPDRVLNYLREGKLSAGHARALINTPNPEELADIVYADELSVRQTEALARRAAEGGPKPAKAKATAGDGGADAAALEQDLADALGLKVSLKDKGGKGELVLTYATLEQLDDLCRRLMRS